MKFRRYSLPLAILACVIAVPLSAEASGSYRPRAPRPPVRSNETDRALYSLGQRVFDGKVVLDAKSKAAQTKAQRARLTALQDVLPPRVAAKKDLASWAGKLTEEQLGALEYYVGKRFTK